jgi:hypothetical protein
MAVKTHVTKIEAAQQGGVLASIVIESDLGLIEWEVHGDLKTDAAIRDPLPEALEQVRQKPCRLWARSTGRSEGIERFGENVATLVAGV